MGNKFVLQQQSGFFLRHLLVNKGETELQEVPSANERRHRFQELTVY